MDARTSKRQKRVSKIQEKRVAEATDGHTQAASGATRLGGGGDVRAPGVRFECKFTESGSYSLKKDILDKLRTQAIKGGLETPVLQLDFRDPRTNRSERYAIQPSLGGGYLLTISAYGSILLDKETLSKALTGRDRAIFGFGTTYEDAELYEVMNWDTYLQEVKASRC